MRNIMTLSFAALLACAALLAQGGGTAAPPGAPAPVCAPNGYGAQRYYGMFAQNDDGFTAYEMASPCIGKDVRDVAESIGMGRGKVMTVKSVIGVQFRADGTMADGAGMARLTNAEFHLAYYLPAMRMFLKGTKANGQPLNEIRVFANQYAWNESQEGRGATAATNTLNDRLPLLKLTPFGAVWSLIDAEGHTVVSKTADGKTVLTGTSPYDGIETSVTVEDSRQHPKLGPYDPTELIRLPVAVTAKANGHTWGATFADYRGDLEPNVWMIFPTTIKWTLDGKPFADLKVTFFRSNPYIVFPIPDVVNAGASAPQGPNLPLRNVATSYKPVGTRVSPQDGYARQIAPSGTTPRDADGHPDLSGNWTGNIPNVFMVPGLRRPGAFEADQSSMQRGAQWNKPLYKPEFWEKVRSLDYGKVEDDPFYGCYKPLGVPRQNVPGRIVQKNGQIWLLNTVENALRILPLDSRKRDENDYQFSTYNGMGLAHWEGDTLVIESVGFNGISWLGWEGYFHTDKMEVTERFTRNGDLLYYNFTVTDPDVLQEPWTSYTYVRRNNPNPNRQDEAPDCEERDLGLLADPYLRG
ncbi:MAG TPA: hypothetical protein VGJ78_09680 [Vicinamibacterales bacterium]